MENINDIDNLAIDYVNKLKYYYNKQSTTEDNAEKNKTSKLIYETNKAIAQDLSLTTSVAGLLINSKVALDEFGIKKEESETYAKILNSLYGEIKAQSLIQISNNIFYSEKQQEFEQNNQLLNKSISNISDNIFDDVMKSVDYKLQDNSELFSKGKIDEQTFFLEKEPLENVKDCLLQHKPVEICENEDVCQA